MTAPVAQGSIRQRLLLLLLASAAAIGVLLYVVVLSIAQQFAQSSQDNILAASAISILDSARTTDGVISVDLPYSALSMLGSVTDERAFYAIRLDDEFLSGYDNLPRADGYAEESTVFQSASYLGEEVRIASTRRGFSTDVGQAFLEVSVAQTLTGMNRTLARISRISIAVAAGFFVLLVLLAMLVARSTIHPLHQLTESVSRRGPSDLRPVVAPVPSEMAPLVSSLNSLMGRLQHSLSRSEDFITEAAHRVRTPLAIVRTQAEITLRRVEKPENRETVREMIRAIDESSRTAGQLLDHAMVTFRTDSLANENVALHLLVREAVDRLQPLFELKDVDVTITQLDEAVVQGDPILLQNALQNVLDNAIKYSSRNCQVDVALQTGAGGTRIVVSDTGPGFPDLDTDRLTERFARGENATAVIGSGLGLTIADEIMRAHGGAMALSNNNMGGACVVLSFPFA